MEDISWRVENLLACAEKEENFIEDSKLILKNDISSIFHLPLFFNFKILLSFLVEYKIL